MSLRLDARAVVVGKTELCRDRLDMFQGDAPQQDEVKCTGSDTDDASNSELCDGVVVQLVLPPWNGKLKSRNNTAQPSFVAQLSRS